MASTYSGRLELTWTNKDMRLLAHEDGRYEWVQATDYRVAETRLLHNVTTVGDVGEDTLRASDNLLIRGDALNGRTSLLDPPEFARVHAGKMRLCYIDPPFNTSQAFEHYDDALEYSVWLMMMRDRLLQVRRLLSENGSVWLHLDDAEAHRERCVLDEVFGAGNLVVEVKRDSDISTEEVQQKWAAAKHWVNHVNAAEQAEAAGWRYLLLSETDIQQARGSWKALCTLGT